MKQSLMIAAVLTLALGAAAEEAPFYGKVGVSWSHKIVTEFSGTQTVSKVSYEVVAVDEERQLATVRVESATMVAGTEFKGPPSETTMSLAPVAAGSGSTEGEGGSVETRDETITVEAGEFACRVTEATSPASTSTSWMSVDHPGLVVKQVTKSAGSTVTTELLAVDLGD